MSIKGTRPDPTDTGTLRPDIALLENQGTQFQPLDCPLFDKKINLLTNTTPSDTLGIFILFFLVPIVKTIV